MDRTAWDATFSARFGRHADELKWLYCELYHNDLQYYFYPVENRRQAARWALIVDLLREERMKNGQE